MVKPFPTEILERIIFYYFRRDELLHTPEENFTLVTPARGSTSLLLVSRTFRQLVLPSLFYSISITQSHHWELLFRLESGIMAGEGEEARTRRSWVRELRFDFDVQLPIALQPDGITLSPDPFQQVRDGGTVPFTEAYRSLSLISVAEHPSTIPNRVRPFLPNLNRLTLLHSSLLPATQPWPTHLLKELGNIHLENYRREKGDPSASFPGGIVRGVQVDHGETRLEEMVLRWLEKLKEVTRERFLESLVPKDIWVSAVQPQRLERTFNELVWSDETVVKHLVYPSPSSLLLPPTFSPSSPASPSDELPATLLRLEPLLHVLASTHEIRYRFCKSLRFETFPLTPLGRRAFWESLVRQTEAMGLIDDYLAEDDGRGLTLSEKLLELVKTRNWAWVEEDGMEVEFEKGLGLDETENGEESDSDTSP